MVVLLNDIDLTLKFFIFEIGIEGFFESSVVIFTLFFLNIIVIEHFSSNDIELADQMLDLPDLF